MKFWQLDSVCREQLKILQHTLEEVMEEGSV